MPYTIVKVGKNKYSVVNTETHTAHSFGTSLAKAQAQVRLLHGVERGWKPTKARKRSRSRSRSRRR